MKRRISHRRHRWALLFQLSRTYTDIIILAQVLGVIANIVWYLKINTSDFVGFIYVGGDIAGLFAYFGFMLFAVLFFVLSPRRFWYSLHPVAFGLGLIILAMHRLWDANGTLIAVAILTGALIGRFAYRFVLLYPRLSLIGFFAIVILGRFFMPRFAAPYAITCMGALLIMLVCAPRLLRLLARR